MTDVEKRADAADDPAAKKGPEKEKAAEPKKAGLDYVFKITPADPKNSFDFEDVADK